MDPDIGRLEVKAPIADRAQEVRPARAIGSHHADTGVSRRTGCIRKVRRLALAGMALALAAASLGPGPAAAAAATWTSMGDPWAPFAAVLEGAAGNGWTCVGLPHPARSEEPGEGLPLVGDTRCVGLGCAWEPGDDRLVGTVTMDPGVACTGPGASGSSPLHAASGPACPGGTLSLHGPSGSWAGVWSRFAEDDWLVVLAGTGPLQGWLFVGHWTDAGAAHGHVRGIVTDDGRLAVLLWPVPFL